MINDVIEQIMQARMDYVQIVCRNPTHILISHKLHSDLLRYVWDSHDFSYNTYTNKATLLGMLVVPVADSILPENEYGFILLSDETSKNFPQ